MEDDRLNDFILARQTEMLIPHDTAHAANRVLSLSTCIRSANLRVKAIVAYAESFEFNDYLSSNGKDSVETTLCYANTDCSRTISNNNLVVEVALHIVASDIAFDLHRLLHLLIAVACGDILLVCLFQLGDGHYIGLADAAIADTGLVSGLHRLIVVALAGREG